MQVEKGTEEKKELENDIEIEKVIDKRMKQSEVIFWATSVSIFLLMA